MIMKPFDAQSVEMPDEIQDILEASGISTPKVDTSDKQNVRKVFDDAGASVKNAASEVAKVMSYGESDAGRLKAAELVLKIHGAIQEIDENKTPAITINILGQQNKSLINLVVPTT